MDDIIIFSETIEEHMQGVEEILIRLKGTIAQFPIQKKIGPEDDLHMCNKARRLHLQWSAG